MDVWTKSPTVSWEMPVGGAAASTAAGGRKGRWRSFPYLIYYDGEHEGVADANLENAKHNLWEYFCYENPSLVRFKFFMLQSSTLPNMMFGPTSKRLIVDYSCVNRHA